MSAETQIIVSAKDLATDVFHKIELSHESLVRSVEKFENIVPFASFGLGAYMGAEALKELTQGTFEYMDHMGKLGQQVGMTSEEISKYSYVAMLADVSQESMVKSVERLSKNMAGAAGGVSEGMDSMAAGGNKVRASLIAMGFSQRDIKQGLNDMPSFLGKIADKFMTYEDGAKKTALAMNLFSKSGAVMIPMLNKGSEAFKEMFKEAEGSGGVIGGDIAKQAEEVDDNFKRLHARIEGVKIIIATGLLPTFETLSDVFLDQNAKAGDYTTTINVLGASIKTIAQGALFLGAALTTSAEGYGMLKDMATKNGGAELWKAIEERSAKIEATWKRFAEQSQKLDLFGQHPAEEHKAGSGSEDSHSKAKKTQAPLADTNTAHGMDAIKALHEEALKAQSALQQVQDTYAELTLTLAGDTYGAELMKNQSEYDKQYMESLKEFQKVQDERKALATKGRLTPEAAATLDQTQVAVLARMAGLEVNHVLKDIQAGIKDGLEKMAHDASHTTTMAGFTGQGVYEAQLSAIKAKYDALRADPKTKQYKGDWDAEEQAAVARAGKDQEKTLAQQRGELAQLTGNNEEYYESQVKVLTIERDLASTEAERKLKQEQLNKARAQANGDGLDGLRRGLTEYSASARDMWQNFSSMGKNAAQDVENALTDALSGKKVNISTLIQQLNGEFARATIVRPLMGLATDALSKSELLGSFFGGKTGDAAGDAASAVSLGTSAAALDTSALAIETSSVSLDAAAVAMDASALALDMSAMSLEGAAAALSAGGGLSALSSAGGGLGLLDDAVGGFFSLDGMLAGGGPTGRGKYLVGENGPELLDLSGSGYVYNNTELSDMLSGSSDGSTVNHFNVTIPQTFDFRGADTGAETRLRAYAGVIKKEATAAAVASVRAESLRGGRYAKDLRRGV
ncbi:phage tail tape measure C-terminal domain-containing protein [Humidesulfovibrio idahonensis]